MTKEWLVFMQRWVCLGSSIFGDFPLQVLGSEAPDEQRPLPSSDWP